MQAYLAGTGPVTRFWDRKHNILDGFYRFAISRGYVASTPLPRTFPKPLKPFGPYVYSHEELKRLLSAIVAMDNPRSVIDPTTFRLLLLMVYGAELRISEALLSVSIWEFLWGGDFRNGALSTLCPKA